MLNDMVNISQCDLTLTGFSFHCVLKVTQNCNPDIVGIKCNECPASSYDDMELSNHIVFPLTLLLILLSFPSLCFNV